jgi:hypothetical protein
VVDIHYLIIRNAFHTISRSFGLFRKKKIAEKNTVSIASTILWLANSPAADFQSDL